MSPIARMLASSVARGVSSGVSIAELIGVLAKRRDPLLGVVAQRHAGLLRTGDRLVVDVGVVDDLAHLVAAEVLQRAPQHVDADEGAEVADVRARVDRRAAGVHADGVVARRGERLFLSGQGVVETKHEDEWARLKPGATLVRVA